MDLPPDRQRDIMLEMFPALVNKYSDVSSQAAADWYEALWSKYFDDDPSFIEALNPYGDEAATREMQRIVRARAGYLWEHDGRDAAPNLFVQTLGNDLTRSIRDAGHQTVYHNVRRDPYKPRYARVPGFNPCPFCIMLASRGYVYASAESAGGLSHEYHNNDHCEIVPEWNKYGKNTIEGYDPDEYYDMYIKAREMLENGITDPDLKEKVENSAEYTVTKTADRRNPSSTTYGPGSPNNANSLSLVMQYLYPDKFPTRDHHAQP